MNWSDDSDRDKRAARDGVMAVWALAWLVIAVLVALR